MSNERMFKLEKICEFHKLESPLHYLEDVKSYIFDDVKRTREEIKLIVEGETKYEKDIRLGELVPILILSKPFVVNNEKLTSEFILDFTEIDNFKEYFNLIIKHFRKKDIDVRNDIGWIIDELTNLSNEINYRKGITISLHSLLDTCHRFPRFSELMNYEVDLNENIEIDKMVKETNSLADEVYEILGNDEESVLNSFINAKSGINKNQLAQCCSYIGLKPDQLLGRFISKIYRKLYELLGRLFIR